MRPCRKVRAWFCWAAAVRQNACACNGSFTLKLMSDCWADRRPVRLNVQTRASPGVAFRATGVRHGRMGAIACCRDSDVAVARARANRWNGERWTGSRASGSAAHRQRCSCRRRGRIARPAAHRVAPAWRLLSILRWPAWVDRAFGRGQVPQRAAGSCVPGADQRKSPGRWTTGLFRSAQLDRLVAGAALEKQRPGSGRSHWSQTPACRHEVTQEPYRTGDKPDASLRASR